MIHGDISNRVSAPIAIRVDNFLVKYNLSPSIIDRVKALRDPMHNAYFDPHVLSLVEYLFRHTDMTVDLVISLNVHTKRMREFLEQVPFNRIISIVKPVEISVRLYTGDFGYYVDEDLERMSLINHKYCVGLPEINSLVRRRNFT